MVNIGMANVVNIHIGINMGVSTSMSQQDERQQ